MRPPPLIASIGDLLWVPRCAACDAPLPEAERGSELSAFCAPCASSLVPATSPLCPRCGLAFETGGSDHLCGSCLASPPPFASLAARFEYGGALAAAISRFKYGPSPHLAAPLSALLFARYAPPDVDIVVPVPLHPRRLRQRGFNQSALLLGAAPRPLKSCVRTSILRRAVDTPHQAGLARRERLDALRDAFRARPAPEFRGARVLLVDDVATTTATMRACASALLDAGAAEVRGLCLARAM
jgi:ComF family protein